MGEALGTGALNAAEAVPGLPPAASNPAKNACQCASSDRGSFRYCW